MTCDEVDMVFWLIGYGASVFATAWVVVVCFGCFEEWSKRDD